jgi:hypothetical protein
MFEEAGENSRVGNQEFGIENWEFENLHLYMLLCVWFPCLKDQKKFIIVGEVFIGIWNEAKKIF